MPNAIVVSGCKFYPQHLGKVVEMIGESPCEMRGGSVVMLVRTDPPLLTNTGIEIWWQPHHLSPLPPVADEVEDEVILNEEVAAL